MGTPEGFHRSCCYSSRLKGKLLGCSCKNSASNTHLWLEIAPHTLILQWHAQWRRALQLGLLHVSACSGLLGQVQRSPNHTMFEASWNDELHQLHYVAVG